MRFTITRDNLIQGLKAVGGVIPSRTTLPILQQVSMEAAGDVVEMRGTNLDTAAVLRVPAEVDKPGAITAPAKKLLELAKELPEAPVSIRSKPQNRVEVTCGSGTFELEGFDVEETPELPGVAYDGAWTLTAETLQDLVRLTAFCASTEESRPILNAVCWELGTDGMRMVATNGHRMARAHVESAPFGVTETVQLLVRPAALAMLARMFAPEDELEVGHNDGYVGFRTDKAEVMSRLTEGPYPNYEAVIPARSTLTHEARVDRASFRRSLARANVIADTQHHRCTLEFSDGGVRIQSTRADLGNGVEQLSVEVSDPITICFNGVYLADVIDRIDADEAVFRMVGPDRAALITPAEQNGVALTYLLMPLRLLDV